MSKFYYLGTDERTIDSKVFFKVSILEMEKKQVFNIYKIKDSSNTTKLATFKTFDEVTDKITYVIKSNGKIGLDIK